MNPDPGLLFDEFQVVIVLAEEKFGTGWILKMNPDARSVLNSGFQACLLSDGPTRRSKEGLIGWPSISDAAQQINIPLRKTPSICEGPSFVCAIFVKTLFGYCLTY